MGSMWCHDVMNLNGMKSFITYDDSLLARVRLTARDARRQPFVPSWSTTRPSSIRKASPIVESFAHRHDSSVLHYNWNCQSSTRNLYVTGLYFFLSFHENLSDRTPFLLWLSWRLPKLGGAKAADAILKKHPEHGETLCMKANPI